MSMLIIRDQMFGNSRLCWNPKCEYAFPATAIHCPKCGWTARGPAGSSEHPKAKGRPVGAYAEMNGAERAYQRHLEREQILGRIRWFAYEPFNLRIGHRCFWMPDFGVITADGYLEAHDVKARWKGAAGPHIEDDAQVKMSALADKLRWLRIVVAWKDGDAWKTKTY